MPQKTFKLGNLSESGFGIFLSSPGAVGGLEGGVAPIRRSVILVSWGASSPITPRLYISHYFTFDHRSCNVEKV